MNTQSQEKASWRIIKFGCLPLIGVAVLIYLGVQVYNLLLNSPDRAVVQTAIKVCNDNAASMAAGHEKDQPSAIQPITVQSMVVVNPGKPWWWGQPHTNDYRAGRLPESVAQLQRVACLGKKYTEEVSGCSYSPGGYLERTQQHQEVRIVAAQTGATLNSFTVSSVVPSCPGTYTVGNKPKLFNPLTTEDIFASLNLNPIPSSSNLSGTGITKEEASQPASTATSVWRWLGFSLGIFVACLFFFIPLGLANTGQEDQKLDDAVGCPILSLTVLAGFLLRIFLLENSWLVLGIVVLASLFLGLVVRMALILSSKSKGKT